MPKSRDERPVPDLPKGGWSDASTFIETFTASVIRPWSVLPDSPPARVASAAEMLSGPWSSCARVRAIFGGANVLCGSATIIAPRVVLTAAHCVAALVNGKVTAARSTVVEECSDLADGAVHSPHSIERVFVDPGWNGTPGSPGDVAIVQLTASALGPSLPLLAYRADAWIKAPGFAIGGFPILEGQPSNALIVSPGRIDARIANDGFVTHNAATPNAGGDSGAPLIVRIRPDVFVVAAIHLGGFELTTTGRNLALRVTPALAQEAADLRAGSAPSAMWVEIKRGP